MLAAGLVFVATFLAVLWWMSRPKNPPPSPGLALPVIGHLYLFKGNPMDHFQQWKERLGNVYSLQMGPFRCVVLSGYDAISKALLKHHESLLERPNNFSHEELFNYAGIISLGGEKWKEQRAFLQSTLRSLGVGKNIMAERIRTETDYLLSAIEGMNGEARDISNLVMVSVTNVICGVAFGKRFDQDDETVGYWLAFMKRLFKLLGSSAEINFFPVLKYVPGDRFHYKELTIVLQSMKATIWKWVDKENRQVNLSDEAFQDLTQAFLTEMERKKSNGVMSTSMDEANLRSTLLSLFNAGTETTTNTIVFAVLYLINFPDLQERIYQEIKENVGTLKAPEVADKQNLKLLTAFIMETQRFCGVVPFGIDRLATDDIHLDGYTITKGTSVMVNFDSLLTDKQVWGDPENFRPDRHLAEDGSVVIKKELLPFGIGKRNCLGESLAVMELYLFISALIQRFELKPESEDSIPTMVPTVGFSKCAQPFKVRAVLRTV